jgi:hypothetical protein
MKTLLDARIAATVNAVTFLGMLVVNILATSLPLNGMETGELSVALPNLFVPSGITFSIWGLIWLLLAAYLFFQIRTAFDRRGGGAEEGGMVRSDPYAPGVVSFWFPLNMALNAGWIFAWHYQLIGLSVLIILALLVTLIVMFLNIDKMIRRTGSQRFARVPISVYFGWVTIATIANITAFLVSVGWGGFGIPDVVWTIVVIAAGFAVNVIMLLRYQNFAFAAVAVWAFAGIVLKRIAEGTPEGPGVVIAAIVAGVVLVVLGVVVAIQGRSMA